MMPSSCRFCCLVYSLTPGRREVKIPSGKKVHGDEGTMSWVQYRLGKRSYFDYCVRMFRNWRQIVKDKSQERLPSS